MPTIKDLMVKFRVDMRDVDTGLQNLNKKIEESTKDLQSKYGAVSEKMRNVGLGLTAAITAPAMLVGKSMLEAGMNAVESENLFEVSFGNMANQARKWSEDMGKSLGLNRYAIRENAATLYVMMNSMGLTTKKSYEMSTGLTQLAYDMASFYNLKPEEAFEKLRSGIAGETEPLKQLGIIVNETTAQTYAWTHGIAKQGEALNEQQKVLARYGVIMEATNKAQGDLARTAESPVNQLRRMKEQASEVAVQFGQAMIPAFQQVLGWVSELVTWLSGLTDSQKKWLLVIGLVAAVVGPAILVLSQLAGAFVTVTTAMGTFQVIKNALAGPAGWAILGGAVLAAGAGMRWLKTEIDNATESMDSQASSASKLTSAISQLSATEQAATRRKMELNVVRISAHADTAWQDLQKANQRVKDTEWGVDGMFGGHARAEQAAADAQKKYDTHWTELQKAREELNAFKQATSTASAIPAITPALPTTTAGVPSGIPGTTQPTNDKQVVAELQAQNAKLQTIIDQQQSANRTAKAGQALPVS